MVAYRRCGSTEIAQIRILLTVSGMTRAEIARRVGVTPPKVTGRAENLALSQGVSQSRSQSLGSLCGLAETSSKSSLPRR